MIKGTRFNGKELDINCEIIEMLEETPDTVITLNTGTKLVVKETAEEIKKAIIDYQRLIFTNIVKK